MPDRHGREVGVVIVKASYRVFPDGSVGLAEQRPVRIVGTETSGARWSSLEYPSDWVDEKVGTDVVVVGTAYPRPRATTAEVSVRIETGQRTLHRVLRVHGPRVYQASTFGVVPGPPGLMEPTPIRYELAYGGVDDELSDTPLVEWRNPSGIGVAKDRRSLVGRSAPRIEAPEGLLDSEAPAVAGLGAIQPSWEPRRSFAGTRDERWARERAPFSPADFDLRFNSVASAGLWSERPLSGAEPVELVGLTPEGVLRLQLPRHAPAVSLSVAGRAGDPRARLDTWLFDPDASIIELTWRASFAMPKKASQLEHVSVTATPPLPRQVLARSA